MDSGLPNQSNSCGRDDFQRQCAKHFSGGGGIPLSRGRGRCHTGNLPHSVGHLYSGPECESDRAVALFAFSGQEGVAEVSGDSADPDRDGRSNLQEYAEGTDPNAPDPLDQTRALIENGVLVFEFRQLQDVADITLTPEFSDDLENWDPEPDQVVGIVAINNGDGTET